jgi:hypothetical protein
MDACEDLEMEGKKPDLTTNVMFSARVAIGVGGVAVIDLVEYCHPDWCIEPDTALELVKDDIEFDGAELWLDRVLNNTKQERPKEHGIYKIDGGALFVSEDDVEYTRFAGVRESA